MGPGSHRPRRRLVAVLAVGLAASTAGGCDCQGGGLDAVGPTLEVTPAAVTFAPTAVGGEGDRVVTLRNTGNAPLTFPAAPKVVEGAEDALAELGLRDVLQPVDCGTGDPRAGGPLTRLLPGGCATVTVTYQPGNLGTDTGTLVLHSDDGHRPEVDVPLAATGDAPRLQVCLLPGDCAAVKTCSQPGQPLAVPFPTTTLDASRSCPVSVANLGATALDGLQWGADPSPGDPAFALDPASLGATGALAPGQGIQATVQFTPGAAGHHQETVEVATSDPAQGRVALALTGDGDGPKLCADPLPTEDFGTVAVSQSATRTVTLTDCGTEPLTVTALSVLDGAGQGPSPEFALGPGAPTTPIPLAAGATTRVPITFTPDAGGPLHGRLRVDTSDTVVPSAAVSLLGEGDAPPACLLQVAATVLDFGRTAPGFPVTRTLALANAGRRPCTGVTATLTAGAAVRFTVTATPGPAPYTLDPGQIAFLGITYDPTDATGPDAGTLTLDGDALRHPREVALTGNPTGEAGCQLSVTPRPGSFDLQGCVPVATQPRIAAYGVVELGTPKTLPVRLENVGALPCTVASVRLDGVSPGFPLDPSFTLATGADQVLVDGQLARTIEPGKVGEVRVTYRPGHPQLDCGLVRIRTTDPTVPGGEDPVYLQGRGAAPDLQEIPGSLDFGRITVGCASQERTVTLYDTGDAAVTLTSAYLAPPGKGRPASGPFTLVSLPPLPVMIPAGGQVKLRIRYRPPDPTPHTALLALETRTATGTSLLTVPLSGQGSADAHQTDHFQQLGAPEVDVLWMIDDSCSMADKQQNLSDNAQAFFRRAVQLSANYQMAVVTTDMYDPKASGRFQSRNGAPRIITPSIPDPVQAFADDAKLGTSGSGIEQGLAAVEAALTPPLVDDPAANAGFLRREARLVIIAVSDEDDQSPEVLPYYVDFLRTLKGFHNADLTSFSSVVGYDDATHQAATCDTAAGGEALAGDRYVSVTRQTGGIARSICASDWGAIVDDLGLNAFGARSAFYLTRAAVASTIGVRVDGQAVARPAWAYDPVSNAVVFASGSVPAPGATVDVDYDTVCH